ncbi:hypothetical protein [Methylotenera sp.]|jgi:hypothetical protein|uniref:hypothetical protein n=1 Tax=Methylotenera sp. TaxID=2051956 RepID=UPI002725193B|nr:hypothetical protein [Methylotenera sp.]MDO9393455.1 hypothetical protein [Methylotenera sp.]MDP1522095.1 hypothetical protein [Methylotenera sp.]MDP2072251.1 hypothetical protein [Methylotenera sp.]MDP2229560.1 hypothetical protein [Methylotenera sp.]MDP3005050.1 hypothetical protein [Methylotenera sp.]
MPIIYRQLILFTTLLFTLPAQAAQEDKHEDKEDVTSPSVARKFPSSESRQPGIDRYQNLDGRFNELEDNQRSNRYGIGYEMRQGGQSNARGGRGRGR